MKDCCYAALRMVLPMRVQIICKHQFFFARFPKTSVPGVGMRGYIGSGSSVLSFAVCHYRLKDPYTT